MIFRKVALERLSSPEQLDQLMQVTNPQGWLALTGLCGLLVASLLWGVYGRIPTEVTGEGILLRHGGVSNVVSNGAGQVEEVLVAVGGVVQKGQVVARLRQDLLQRQIDDSLAKLSDLRAEQQAMKRSADEQKRLRQRDLAQQKSNLNGTIDTLENDIRLLEARRGAEKKLLDDGLITHQTYLDTEQKLNTDRDQLASKKLELNGLTLKDLEAQHQLDQELETRSNSINDLEQQIREDRAKLAENRVVISQYSGRVLELLAARGAVVSPGTPLLSVEVLSEELMAVLFVPAAEGKRIHAGLPARISPTTVKREEYGYILGQVQWTSDFPTSALAMTRLIGNEALVTKLMKEGPPIQIEVALDRDAATPTGYRWSSSRGPNLKISSGTLATGSVIVREQRPVSLVIPTVREKLGV
ncbi:MAG TPA: NHLP bacteriocin system secretion protein [Thermoanaerobaculia bacterium]|nr:NHLP bacteriocin system secretion protein [Thermoanaerobaculia bacterium]